MAAVGLMLQAGALGSAAYRAPGRVDPTFDAGSGVNNIVRLIAVQPDGRILIAGEFSTVRGLARTGIARLLDGGGGDATFDPGDVGVGQYLTSLALQPDGRLLLVGEDGITRLRADGRFDVALDVPIDKICDDGFCSYGINAIAVQPDGKIVIGGYFTTGSGPGLSYGVARVLPDGGLDDGFHATLGASDPGSGTYQGVSAIAVQSDGKVIIGGSFTHVNGTPRSNVARLNADGSLDTGFHPAGAIDGFVNIVVPQPDGKILLAGSFETANRANRSIARLNPNGSPDTTFNAGTGLYDAVAAVALQPDNKILVAGSVDVFGWDGQRVTRLNPDGSRDGTFNLDTGGPGASVSTLALQPDGRVLVGGYFRIAGEVRPIGLARFEADGHLDPGFSADSGLFGISDPTVVALDIQSDGKVLVAGASVSLRGPEPLGIVRLGADGAWDDGFVPAAGAFGPVYAVAWQPDGMVVIGGEFSDAEGATPLAVARLDPDGALDVSFRPDLATVIPADDCPPDFGLGYACYVTLAVTAIAVQADGNVVIGGFRRTTICAEFAGCRDVYRSFVARFDADGNPDPTFGPAEFAAPTGPASVEGLVLQPDGKILVCGWFTSVGSAPRDGVARLNRDGSVDAGFDPGADTLSGPVFTMALQPDGRLIVGGEFDVAEGRGSPGIARLGPDGRLDDSFDPGTGARGGAVFATALQADGKVLIGGRFSSIDGVVRNNLARLEVDGGVDATFDPGGGTDAPVGAIALQPDGNAVIGGRFTSVGGLLRPRVARVFGGQAAPALSIARSGAGVLVSWPATGSPVQLYRTPDPFAPGIWIPAAELPVTTGGRTSVTVQATAKEVLFRLVATP